MYHAPFKCKYVTIYKLVQIHIPQHGKLFTITWLLCQYTSSLCISHRQSSTILLLHNTSQSSWSLCVHLSANVEPVSLSETCSLMFKELDITSSILDHLSSVCVALSLAACRVLILTLSCPRFMQGAQSTSNLFITYDGLPEQGTLLIQQQH